MELWRISNYADLSGGGGLLQVPSAIIPIGKNFLLNPAHPEAAKFTIADVIKAPFDPRLLPGS
jgi:hypothetical protein